MQKTVAATLSAFILSSFALGQTTNQTNQTTIQSAQQRALEDARKQNPNLPKLATGPVQIITIDGKQYRLTGNFTPQMIAQFTASVKAQNAKPELVGTTIREAVSVIMNEPKYVSTITGNLPSDLVTALDRASRIAPVRMANAPKVTFNLPRATQINIPAQPKIAVIATWQHVVMIQGNQIRVIKSPQMAMNIHQQVDLFYKRAGK